MIRAYAVRIITVGKHPDPITGRRNTFARWRRVDAETGDEAAKKAIAENVAETGTVQVRGVTMWDPEIHEEKPDVAKVEASPSSENQGTGFHARHVGRGRWGVFDSSGVRQHGTEKMDEDTAKMLAEALSGRAAV